MTPVLLSLLTLPWAELGHTAAAPEATARGPEHLAACPDGSLVLYDTVLREVVLVEQGQVSLSFPVRFASDLLCTDQGLLVLDHSARSLALWSSDGAPLAEVALPQLVPTGVTMDLDGDTVVAVDLFGNHHPAAQLVPGGLLPPVDPGLRELAGRVQWDGQAVWVDQQRIPVPGAQKASGQLVGDWLVVDAVLDRAAGADGALQVTRTAWYLPTGASVPLPVDGRRYAPRGDLAEGADGQLWVLVPAADALQLWELRP